MLDSLLGLVPAFTNCSTVHVFACDITLKIIPMSISIFEKVIFIALPEFILNNIQNLFKKLIIIDLRQK